MSITVNKKLLLVFFIIAFFGKVQGQDAFFNQYFSAKLFLNPALSASETATTVSTNYRTQAKSTVIPYKTSQVSVIIPFIKESSITNKHDGGVGISVYNDNAGEGNFKTLGAYLSYAFNFPISYDGKSTILSFGIQGGLVQKQVDLTDLQWGSQYQPFVGYVSTVVGESDLDLVQNNMYPDFNAGFLISYNGAKTSLKRNLNYHIGGAVYHLNTPNESFLSEIESTLPRQIRLHAGMEWKIKDKFKLSPNSLFIQQGDVRHINAGMYLSYQVVPYGTNVFTRETEFLIGSWYRFSDSFIFMTGLHNNNLTFGFSYDLNGSNLRSSSQGLGAYEISLTISQFKKSRLKKISTPRI